MFKTLDDLDFAGKTALVRADLNVPMLNGVVTDATRIARLAPTVKDLRAKGAKVVLLSHFGRPKGKRVEEMTLAPAARAVEDVLGVPVTFANDCIGADAVQAIAGSGDAVVVLENLRYHAGEEANDEGFAAALAALGDIYVNDAFSAAHRAHASTHRIAGLMPAVAGRNMQAELEALSAALGEPERPVAAIVGGAKVSTKLAVLENLVGRVELLIIGGGMANTFLYAGGVSVGKSLCEPDLAETARQVMAKAAESGCEIALPGDAVVAREFKAGAPFEVVPIDAIPDDAMMLDVGPETTRSLCEKLQSCRTLIWNGPMGAFEIPPFDDGTVGLAEAVADLTDAGSMRSVAGGGDTVAAMSAAGVSERITYISTAGGAFLEWMEGRALPGVEALAEAAK